MYSLTYLIDLFQSTSRFPRSRPLFGQIHRQALARQRVPGLKSPIRACPITSPRLPNWPCPIVSLRRNLGSTSSGWEIRMPWASWDRGRRRRPEPATQRVSRCAYSLRSPNRLKSSSGRSGGPTPPSSGLNAFQEYVRMLLRYFKEPECGAIRFSLTLFPSPDRFGADIQRCRK